MHSELGTSVPAFLAKLWKLVEDPETDNLISWSSSGLSFYIRDQARFARELLPLYYKHNNMASFVRQLNMYGFHKVVSVDSGGLKLDKDEMEFAHTYFLKGHEYLLEHIKRKIPVSKQEETRLKPEIMTRVFTDVRLIKGKQDTMDSRLAAMKRENEALWREVASLRQKHMKQQQIVNKLIQFLVSIVQPNNRGLGTKRRYPLMIDDINGASTSKSNKPKETATSPTLARKKVTALNTNLKKDATSKDINMTALNSISSGGPIIHDVTDLSDGDDEALVEGDVGFPPEANMETVLRTEFLDSGEVNSVTDSSIPTSDFGHANENKDLNDLLENNDSNLLAKELLAGANTNGLTASEEPPTDPEPASSSVDMDPLSPELLLTVDPTALSVSSPAPSTSALDELDLDAMTDGLLGTTPPTAGGAGKGKAKKVATATSDKQGGKNKDMRVALLDSGANSANTPVGSRHELDTHLDTMQVELDNLRELLSIQGCNVDATTLLGVGDDAPFSYETDSLRPVSTPALPNGGGFNFPQWAGMVQANQMPFHPAMFDHGTLRKLFNGEEPMNPVSHYLSDMDGKGNGAITGNELIAYTPSFFELTSGDENMFSSGPLSPSDMTSDPLPTGNVDVEAEDEDNALNALLTQPAPKKKMRKN